MYLTFKHGSKLMRVNRCAAPNARMWPMRLSDLVKESATAHCGRAGLAIPFPAGYQERKFPASCIYQVARSGCWNERSNAVRCDIFITRSSRNSTLRINQSPFELQLGYGKTTATINTFPSFLTHSKICLLGLRKPDKVCMVGKTIGSEIIRRTKLQRLCTHVN